MSRIYFNACGGIPSHIDFPDADPLEQTQEIDDVRGMFGATLNGVFRLVGDDLRRAPELSERYPSVHIDMTRRQAC